MKGYIKVLSKIKLSTYVVYLFISRCNENALHLFHLSPFLLAMLFSAGVVAIPP
jgi:hypothetical protein